MTDAFKTKKRRITRGISIDGSILRAAQERAAADNRSLSGYINNLILEDLKAPAAGSSFFGSKVANSSQPDRRGAKA